jgi:hypothetical protein
MSRQGKCISKTCWEQGKCIYIYMKHARNIQQVYKFITSGLETPECLIGYEGLKQSKFVNNSFFMSTH